MTRKPKIDRPQPLHTLLQALPGILVWLCILGYLLGGLSWSGPVLLVALLLGCLLAGTLSVRHLGQLNWQTFFQPFISAPIKTLLLSGLLFLIFIGFSSFLPPLVYPANHSLVLCRVDNATDQARTPFLIHAIEYEDGPMVPLLEMKGDQPWNLVDQGLLTQAAEACARFSGFFQGGLVVYLRQGPGAGVAQIEWDGNAQLIDLNSSEEAVRRVVLSGEHPVSATSLRSGLGIAFRVALVSTLVAAAFGLALAFRGRRWGKGPLGSDNLWLVLGLLTLVGLLASGILGQSSALTGDDFCYSGVAQNSGVLNGSRQFYAGVNGRLLGNFAGVLSGYLFPYTQPSYVILVTLALWVASLVPLLTRLLHWLTGRTLSAIAWSLAAAIVLVTLINTPDIYQSLFWRSGRQPLVFPLMILPLVLTLLLDLSGPKRGAVVDWNWLALPLLALAAGAFHEVYAAAQVAMLFISMVVLVIFDRSLPSKRTPLLQGLLWALFGALAGMLVHLLAPGTAERSSVLGSNFEPLRILYGALYDTNVFLFAENLNILTIGAVLLGATLVIRSSQPGRFYSKHNSVVWLALPAVLYTAVLASFAVGHYGISQTMPERTQIIPAFVTTLSALVWGMLGGAEFLRKGQKISKKTLQAVQLGILCIFGVAFVFHGYTMTTRQEEFDHYRRAVNVMISSIEAARLAGAPHVVVSALPDNIFGVENPGVEQRNFVNICVDQLFDINVGFD